MGAGLSMASVNKIKELANSREYSLALELVEHQDLSKSLNPQFLRLCGEIYIKNNRYEDARRCLIMAHRLAPESKRIMYVFVELYLRMGYFELAKAYYDMYMFDAGSCDSRQMEYVWTKHEHPDALKDMEQMLASYMHNLDYDWSFELYLVYKKEEKKEEAHSLAELYAASFKNSENSDRICAIEKGKESADAYFDVYASVEQEDNDERYDALRSEEAELLAADDLRMHPKEAEITVMYEDAFTPAGSEKKVQKMLKKQDREEERKEKKLLKEQRKQEKKLEKQAAKADDSEKETTLEASATEEAKPEAAVETAAEETKPEVAVETAAEETKSETAVGTAEAVEETKPEMAVEATAEKEIKPEVAVETAAEETKPEAAVETAAEETKPETAGDAVVEKEEIEEPEIEKSKKRGLFGKIFRKKKEVEDDTTEYAELVQTSESEIIDAEQDDRPSENPDAEKAAETEAVHAESETDSSETIDTMTTGQADDMRHKSKTMAKNVVVVDDDNDFEAEADTIEELAAKEKSDVEKKIEDKKPAFEFQTVELAPDDFEDQFQVDDFSDKLDAEFGEMKSYEPEPTIEIEVEEPETEAEEPEAEPELEIEEPEAEEPEVEIEEPEVEIEEPEVEIEEPEVEVEEPEAEEPEVEIEEPEADGSESIIEELEVEEPEVEIEEPEVEPEPIIEESETKPELEIEEPEVEPEPESIIEKSETEPEVEIEEPEVEPEPEPIIEESETEPELEIEEPEVEIEEPEVEPEPESIIEESETEPELEIEEPEVETEEPEEELEPESIIEESETEPELEIEESEVETEEPEIEEPEVESEPETEEPEFRVAPFTTKPEKKKLDFPVFKSSLFPDYHKEVKNVENNFDEIMEEAQDKMTENMRKEAQMQKEAEELLASLGISLNSIPAPAVKEEQPGQQGPSRDELKASLKIDTNKKNLLKRIKEYR